MTYSNTNTFDCSGAGFALTLAAELTAQRSVCTSQRVELAAGLRLAVPDSRLEFGHLFAVKCDLVTSSYRYTAAEGTGLYLTVSAPESPKPAVKRRSFRRSAGVRRFVAPRVGRVFALRL